MPVAALALLLATLFCFSAPLRAAEGRIISSERGTCIDGPHELGRVRRLPGTAVTSSKPRNPSEDSYVHCMGVGGEAKPSPPRAGRAWQ